MAIIDEFMALERVRAGAYSRASVDINGAMTSVTGQMSTAKQIASRFAGWELPESRIWVDNNISASRFAKAKGKTRPDWDKAWNAVEAGELDVLILAETSRGSRDDDFKAFVNLCRDRRVMLCVGGTLYDPGNVDHRLTLGISSEVAQAEAERAHARTLRGKAEAAEAGRPSGRPEYGFMRVYNDRGALVRVVPHPDQAAVGVEVITRLAQREQYETICADLNQRGVSTPSGKPGAKWRPQTLKQLARSPRWIGKRAIGVTDDPSRPYAGGETETVDAMWPAVVSEDVWYAAQERIRGGRRIEIRDTAEKLLTGITRCDVCEAPMRAQKGRRYQCDGWTPGDPRGAGHTSILIETADTIVEHAVWVRLSDKRHAALYAEDDEVNRAERAQAKRRILELEQERKRLEADVEAGEVDPRVATARYRGIDTKLAELEPKTRPVLRHPRLAELAGRSIETVAAAWGDLERWEQRDLLVEVTNRIAVKRVGRGGRHSVEAPWDSMSIEWA